MPCGPKTLRCTSNWKSKQSASPSWKRRSKPPNAPRTARLLLSVSSHKNAQWRPSGRDASADIVRSKHPLQMSLAIGAAGVHLGPRALAVAADLNKAKGLSMRKTCAVLRDCFGLQLSSGGLSQALDRLAAKVKPQYDALAAELRQAPALHSDETSWWVAGPGWWLWVFTTQLLTFYVVAQSRGRELLSDILGKDFGGVLVSDCLAI